MAEQSPEALEPFQRGQVAHVISTADGAKEFAKGDNLPPAEWLCVFDSSIRYKRPRKPYNGEGNNALIDPFYCYGLDSDPVPPKINLDDHYAKREIPEGVWDGFLFAGKSDIKKGQLNLSPQLAGYYAINVPRVSYRLWSLGEWLAKVAHQPTAVWWAAGQIGIHPEIQQHIQYYIERADSGCSLDIKRAWRYLFEVFQRRGGQNDRDIYDFKLQIKTDGCSGQLIRKYAEINQPYITAGRPNYFGSKPPGINADVQFHEIIDLDVKYPNQFDIPDIPDNWLLDAVQAFRKNLELAVALENELGGFGLTHICPIEPDPSLKGEPSSRNHDLNGLFFFYHKLFKKLIDLDINAARQEYLSWKQNDESAFSLLRIWAAGQEKITSNGESAKIISSLTDNVFWSGRCQRDLLLTLSKRWSKYSKNARQKIEKRLIEGRPKYSGETEAEYKEHNAWLILNRIHWLSKQGCQFSFDLKELTQKLKTIAPDWETASANRAADSLESAGGWVVTDTEYSELINEPINNIIYKAESLTGYKDNWMEKRDPFKGYVEYRPVRAFSALVYLASKNEFPETAWRHFLSSGKAKLEWPRFVGLIAERISVFPDEAIVHLMAPITDWLESQAATLLIKHPASFEKLWKKIIHVLYKYPNTGNTHVVRGDKDPDWASESLNSPVGKLVQTLMLDPRTKELKSKSGFPPVWRDRLCDLLSLGDNLYRYTLVFCGRSLNWLFYIDPEWTASDLIEPLFQSDDQNQDAFWAGLFGSGQIPTLTPYTLLKPHMLKLATGKSKYKSSYLQNLAGILLAGWSTIDEENGGRIVEDDEMRHVLLDGSDELRSQVIWYLERWAGKEDDSRWKQDTITFLANVWPRQKKANGPGISLKLCNFALSGNLNFPKVVDTITPFIAKVDKGNLNHSILRKSKETGDSVVHKYPGKTLELLHTILPEDVSRWPYFTNEFLDAIENADQSLKIDDRFIVLRRLLANSVH